MEDFELEIFGYPVTVAVGKLPETKPLVLEDFYANDPIQRAIERLKVGDTITINDVKFRISDIKDDSEGNSILSLEREVDS
jgi:hypothetical protein